VKRDDQPDYEDVSRRAAHIRSRATKSSLHLVEEMSRRAVECLSLSEKIYPFATGWLSGRGQQIEVAIRMYRKECGTRFHRYKCRGVKVYAVDGNRPEDPMTCVCMPYPGLRACFAKACGGSWIREEAVLSTGEIVSQVASEYAGSKANLGSWLCPFCSLASKETVHPDVHVWWLIKQGNLVRSGKSKIRGISWRQRAAIRETNRRVLSSASRALRRTN
jgi:hypothetical protein